MNYFEQLNAINCNDKVEKKNNLSYLSWAYAWGELKKLHPTAFYTIYENNQGWNYHTDGRTAWVKTGVTVDVDGTLVEHIEELPVMNYSNKSIPLEDITSFDVNKAIQRSLTKAVARHGLGLYIYAGEDLPEGEKPPAENTTPKKQFQRVEPLGPICDQCGQEIRAVAKGGQVVMGVDKVIERSKAKYGFALCYECARKQGKNEGA